MDTAPELMTAAEVAAELRVSARHVARLVERGVLTEHAKFPGLRGPRVFHRDEVTRVVTERTAS